MFLLGGPAYSGTTLLVLLVDQDGIACLNEPDFHNPEQSHNGLPVLARRYPEKTFPPRTCEPMTFEQAFELMQTCQRLIHPDRLGVKFCNQPFVEFAALFRRAGFPVIAIIRDVRDALVRPLLPYVGGEAGLVQQYRRVWEHRDLYDGIIRYEELVSQTDVMIENLSRLIEFPLRTKANWHPDEVHPSMLYPRYRHYLLEAGKVTSERVGIWKHCGKSFSPEAHALSHEMGY